MRDEVAYQGKVSIKIKNKPPVRVKNAGTIELFALICNMLGRITSNSESFISMLPAYMSIIRNDATVAELLKATQVYNKFVNYCILTDPISIVSKDVQSDGSLTLHAKLSNSQLTSVSDSDGGASYKILLLSGDQKILAHAQVQAEAILPIAQDANMQAVIEWTLRFTNKESN